MIMKRAFPFFLGLGMILGFKADLPAYRLYSGEGKAIRFDEMVQELRHADVILFGEYHDNAIAHWIQYELTQQLLDADTSFILGAEMFEADNQVLLDEYFADIISEKNFEKEARLWPNYKTDYKPLVQLAREHQRPFIATNTPRRYASAVYSNGLEGLANLGKPAVGWLPPLPIEVDTTLPSYQSMLEMGMGHGGLNLVYAQAIKDATMGWHIAKAIDRGHKMIHYNGSFHSDFHEGIEIYVRKYGNPNLKVLTLSCVESEDPSSWNEEDENKADYLIYVDAQMTKTH